MHTRAALLALSILTPAAAFAGPMANPSEIAPRGDVTSGIAARRAAADARREAIRPASRPGEWEGEAGMVRTLRLLDAAERVEGIKALRRGMAKAPDGDRIGDLRRRTDQGALPTPAPAGPLPAATNPSGDNE